MVAPSYLRSLQAIELALRLGSLTKAADALSITPAAVGQRIKAIEDYLGLELVVRGRSGLQATPALSAALQHLHAALGANDDETSCPVKFRLWVDRRMSRGYAELDCREA